MNNRPMEAEKQEKTDNELIADFMGRRYGKNADHNGYLKYATSWDHLMPVVEKISQLESREYTVAIHTQKEPSLDGHECSIYDIGHTVEIGFSSKDLINCVYVSVVDFIKWYNTQKPLPL